MTEQLDLSLVRCARIHGERRLHRKLPTTIVALDSRGAIVGDDYQGTSTRTIRNATACGIDLAPHLGFETEKPVVLSDALPTCKACKAGA